MLFHLNTTSHNDSNLQTGKLTIEKEVGQHHTATVLALNSSKSDANIGARAPHSTVGLLFLIKVQPMVPL